MENLVQSTIKKYNAANQKKQKWENLLNECYHYFLPQLESSNIGTAKSYKLYDSTGVISLQSFAANLKYSLIPAWQRWCEIVVSPSIDLSNDQQDQANRDINKYITEPLFNFLSQSNFDVEAGTSLLELGIGTGALLLNEGSGSAPFIFSAVPIRDLVLEESAKGEIQTVYRKHSLAPDKILEIWPSAKIMPNYSNRNAVELLEGTIYQAETQNYQYLVIDITHQEIIYETNFEVSPWIIFRWSKVAGEVYGRGPAMQCLPDIKEANKIKELSLQNALLSVVPTYMVSSDGVINPHTLKIRPGGIIPVRNLQGGSPIVPLPRGSELGSSQFLLQQAREVVEKSLFTNRLGSPSGKVRSATELVLRNQDLMRDLGSAFSRLQTELVQKLMHRCIYILKKKGLIGGISTDINKIKLNITSPLARIQNQEDLQSLVQMLPFFNNFPDEFRLSIKTEEIPRWIATKTGVPASLIRTEIEKTTLANLVRSKEPQKETSHEAKTSAAKNENKNEDENEEQELALETNTKIENLKIKNFEQYILKE